MLHLRDVTGMGHADLKNRRWEVRGDELVGLLARSVWDWLPPEEEQTRWLTSYAWPGSDRERFCSYLDCPYLRDTGPWCEVHQVIVEVAHGFYGRHDRRADCCGDPACVCWNTRSPLSAEGLAAGDVRVWFCVPCSWAVREVMDQLGSYLWGSVHPSHYPDVIPVLAGHSPEDHWPRPIPHHYRQTWRAVRLVQLRDLP